MARTKRTSSSRRDPKTSAVQVPARSSSIPEGWKVAGLYLFLTLWATFPLVFNPAHSLYSPTDHVSTDIYSTVAVTLWWPKYAVWNLGSLPTRTGLLCAPFSQFIPYPSLIGWFILPITLLAGPILANNLLTWTGYFLSAFFASMLAYHLTRHRLASGLAGVVFAFCPYMLLRGYTTYDTVQAQWIPLYVLALFKFDEERSWKHAGLITLSMIGAIFLSFPYYFIFLPILTATYLAVRLFMHYWDRRDSAFWSSLTELAGLQDVVKLAAVGAAVAVIFGLHYRFAIQPPPDLPRVEAGLPVKRSIDQQWELRMATKDYFIPVQQSAVFGELVKDHWQEVYQTERRNSINSSAYVGYIALLLALYGVYRRRDWKAIFFVALGLLALVTTLGPYLKFSGLNIPTPAWLMFQYASFVRRINVYKVYVQLAVAVLAGVGLSLFLERFKTRRRQIIVAGGLIALTCFEYTIVPPFINTDVTWMPQAYRWLSQAQGDPVVLEYPVRKAWGADYQGYAYYQTFHRKRLFNGWVENSYIPLSYRAFWKDMEVPAAIADESNQALLRHFGVQYVLKHYRVQSQTTILRSLPQPDFDGLSGIKLAYPSPDFRRDYRDFSPAFTWQNVRQLVTDVRVLDYPHDYIWTDIYEVVAEPAAVMLTWDYRSPYPTSAEASEYFAVHLSEREKDFYPPTMLFFDGERWTAILQFDNAESLREQAATHNAPLDLRAWRMMKNDGKMEALNILGRKNDFDIAFDVVSFEVPRHVEVWVGEQKFADMLVGTKPTPVALKNLRLERDQRLNFRFHALEGPTKVMDDQGGAREATVAFHNFRVIKK